MLWIAVGKLAFARAIGGAVRLVHWGHAHKELNHYNASDYESFKLSDVNLVGCCLDSAVLILLAWALDLLERQRLSAICSGVTIQLQQGMLDLYSRAQIMLGLAWVRLGARDCLP